MFPTFDETTTRVSDESALIAYVQYIDDNGMKTGNPETNLRTTTTTGQHIFLAVDSYL